MNGGCGQPAEGLEEVGADVEDTWTVGVGCEEFGNLLQGGLAGSYNPQNRDVVGDPPCEQVAGMVTTQVGPPNDW